MPIFLFFTELKVPAAKKSGFRLPKPGILPFRFRKICIKNAGSQERKSEILCCCKDIREPDGDTAERCPEWSLKGKDQGEAQGGNAP